MTPHTPSEYAAIATQSEVVYVVLGRGEDFALISLTDDTYEEAKARTQGRGFAFCGLYAIKDGVPTVKCEPEVDAIGVMMLASVEFVRLTIHLLVPEKKGDSTDWLARLHSLEDSRST